MPDDSPIEPSRRLVGLDAITCRPCRRAAVKQVRKLLALPGLSAATPDPGDPRSK